MEEKASSKPVVDFTTYTHKGLVSFLKQIPLYNSAIVEKTQWADMLVILASIGKMTPEQTAYIRKTQWVEPENRLMDKHIVSFRGGDRDFSKAFPTTIEEVIDGLCEELEHERMVYFIQCSVTHYYKQALKRGEDTPTAIQIALSQYSELMVSADLPSVIFTVPRTYDWQAFSPMYKGVTGVGKSQYEAVGNLMYLLSSVCKDIVVQTFNSEGKQI